MHQQQNCAIKRKPNEAESNANKKCFASLDLWILPIPLLICADIIWRTCASVGVFIYCFM